MSQPVVSCGAAQGRVSALAMLCGERMLESLGQERWLCRAALCRGALHRPLAVLWLVVAPLLPGVGVPVPCAPESVSEHHIVQVCRA